MLVALSAFLPASGQDRWAYRAIRRSMYREQGLQTACGRLAQCWWHSLEKNASVRAAPVISPSSVRAQEALATSGNGMRLAGHHTGVERSLLEGG